MLYFAHGSALLTAEELFEPSVFDRVTEFYLSLSKGIKPEPIKFSTGELDADNALKGFIIAAGSPLIDFKPIGIGKPLTVQVREIYTGKYPKKVFGNKKDMLVTSAIKSLTSPDDKPLAINFLMNRISPKSRIERPSASDKGTPFIFYSPALTEKSMTLDLAIIFDTFPEETFEQVGGLFTAAAGVPIFLSYSVYLIAAGMIIKIVGKAGEKYFDGDPVFKTTVGLDIEWPGRPALPAGFLLITSFDVDQLDKDFRSKYKVNASGKVVDKDEKEYDGDVPFIVISLDGTPQDELASFTPTALSAALLSRFYGIKDNQEQPLNLLIDAVKLYNDLSFRKKADALAGKISKLPDTDPSKEELKKIREAYINNISENLLKPSA